MYEAIYQFGYSPNSSVLEESILTKNCIPWMWGINGICSVSGSVMAIVIAIRFGFTETLLVDAGCYFIVFLVFKQNSVREASFKLFKKWGL